MLYTADFETTTKLDPITGDVRVWATGICEINDSFKFTYGNNINFLYDVAMDNPNSTFYFHNEKFDGEFILNDLFRKGYSYTNSRKLNPGQFTTLISDKGVWYSLEIQLSEDNKVTIYDSLKILALGVAKVAKAFGLEESKLSIDYDLDRPIGHKLTDIEVKYLCADVTIMAKALKTLFDQGMTQMTQGSNALQDYKKIVGKKEFKRWFPVPKYDYFIRQSYKGGFTYANPRYKNKNIKSGIVLDVNSLYPSVMYYEKLPYGEGVFYEGKYKKDKLYNLYVQLVTCSFELKKDHIPTIQLKNSLSFVPTEYLESSNGEDVALYLTNVDLELFLEHYEVYDINYVEGWKFKSTTGLFKDYIDKWNKIKTESTLNGNEGMRTIAKLMLNSLYGKFALNPNVCSKIPYFADGMVKYRKGEDETREPIYIPVGVFITAYARNKTIRSAQSVFDRFLYADTDSLHLIGVEIPDSLEIDKVKLGAWKHESTFERARFVRAKTYIEEITVTQKQKEKLIKDGMTEEQFYLVNGKTVYLNITCAGMPERCYENVTWENFVPGTSYGGKLQFQHVPGGIILKDIDFTIQM